MEPNGTSKKPVGTGDGNTNKTPVLGKKYKQWFLTINNDVMATISRLKLTNYTYLHITCERGTLEQHFHAHAHVKFKSARYFGGIKTKFPKVNISRVRNAKATHDYIMKEKTWAGYRFLYEKGNVVYEINKIAEMNANTFHDSQLVIYNPNDIKLMIGKLYSEDWIEKVSADFMVWLEKRMFGNDLPLFDRPAFDFI